MAIAAVGVLSLALTACSSTSELTNNPGVKSIVDKVQSAAQTEVAKQLTVVLQQKIDEAKAKNAKIQNPDGTINWDEVGRTNLVDYTFASIAGFDYKATLQANGTFEVMQVKQGTGEKSVFAQYRVQFVNGEIVLQ